MTSCTAKLAPPAVVIVPVSATCAVRARGAWRRVHGGCTARVVWCVAWCVHGARIMWCWVRGGCVAGVGGCNFGASWLQIVRPQLGAGV